MIMRSYNLIIIPSAALCAFTFTTSPTISIHRESLSQPTAAFEDESHAAVRRDATNRASTSQLSLVTSYAPSYSCGWMDRDVNSGLYCKEDAQCLFHRSDSTWPAMRGCCPFGYENGCEFETTCYDSSRISATPSLLSPSDPFAVYCIETGFPSCFPLVYPQLGFTDYACGDTPAKRTVYTDITITPTATSSLEYITMISISYVPDGILQDLSSGDRRTSSPSPSPSPSSAPVSTSGSTSTAVRSSAGSTTPVGAIVGGVVGGVIGVGIIFAGCFMFWLSMKKSKKETTKDQLNSQSPPVLQQIQNSIISEAGGKQILNSGRAELYVPEMHDVRQKPVEMDSHDSKGAVELPSN
jgi:hypothetical protein